MNSIVILNREPGVLRSKKSNFLCITPDNYWNCFWPGFSLLFHSFLFNGIKNNSSLFLFFMGYFLVKRRIKFLNGKQTVLWEKPKRSDE